jgi:hypothetical protein
VGRPLVLGRRHVRNREMGKQREFPNKRWAPTGVCRVTCLFEELFKSFNLLESLILAQDERWRRA